MSYDSFEVVEEFKARYLKESVEESLRDIEAGRVRDVDEFFDELLGRDVGMII